VFYTRSKLINNGAETSGSNNVPNNPQNPVSTQLERSVSTDDVPNTFVFSYTYRLPFGKNRDSGLVKYLIAGWAINGLLRYESGRPLGVTMNNDLSGLLFNYGKRPNVVVGATATVDQGSFDPGKGSYLNKVGLDRPWAFAVWQRPKARRTHPRVPKCRGGR
jgi:hypothetical protein